MQKILICTTMALCSLITSILALAVNAQFHGVLQVPPACTINDGETIVIDFGDKVGVNKVDGTNYQQTVNYQIKCNPGSPSWSLGLSFIGTPTSYDNAAVQTNSAGLGIRMKQAGQPFIMNQRIPINEGNPPILEVVPVKDPNKDLVEGVFEATATLQADYQ